MLPIGLWPRHGWRVSTGFFESPKVEDVKDIAILCNFSSHGCVLHCSRWLRLLHPGCWCRSAVRCSYSMVSFHQLILKGGAPAHQNVLGVSVRTLGSSWMALILWAFVGWGQKKNIKNQPECSSLFFSEILLWLECRFRILMLLMAFCIFLAKEKNKGLSEWPQNLFWPKCKMPKKRLQAWRFHPWQWGGSQYPERFFPRLGDIQWWFFQKNTWNEGQCQNSWCHISQ